jgi:branched-chain amino acid transport system substrate-binding protein
MEVLKGLRINGPRGAIYIDPQTRDSPQTVYIRRVERVNGQLYNTEFAKFAHVRDPAK